MEIVTDEWLSKRATALAAEDAARGYNPSNAIGWADLAESLLWDVEVGVPLQNTNDELIIAHHPTERSVRIEIVGGLATKVDEGDEHIETHFAEDPRELVRWLVAGWYLQVSQGLAENLRAAELTRAAQTTTRSR